MCADPADKRSLAGAAESQSAATAGLGGDRPTRPGWHAAALLALFAIVYLALGLSSLRQKSATWDEPQHLTAGLRMDRASDFRVDPEHPPFARRWAALPLALTGRAGLAGPDVPADWGLGWLRRAQFDYCHRVLFGTPDAYRLLATARPMVLALGVLLGLLIFCWARELFGFGAAAAVLLLYLLEPNLMAHARLVTSDFAVTCFLFAAVYAIYRLVREPTWRAGLGFVVATALAAVSKFSAPILGPLALLLFATRVLRNETWGGARTRARRALLAAGLLASALLASWGTIWAAYDFRYEAAPAPVEVVRLDLDESVRARVPRTAAAVGWSERHRLLPNAFAQGFLYGRLRAEGRAAYLLGEVSLEGFRLYFPVAILAKTPLALLLALGAGLLLLLRRQAPGARARLHLLLPIALFLGAAMVSNLNIGLRHILPIYPFFLLVAGCAFAAALRRARALAVVLVLLLAAVESFSIRPDYLAFFNVAAGGPDRGDAILVDSNLDWGQDLPGLATWMRDHDVEHVNLSYFGTADPEAYGIRCTYLPGSPFFAAERVAPPRLPGYLAVSVTNLRGVYLNEAGRRLYAPLLDQEPVATIGHSIRIYRVDGGTAPRAERGATPDEAANRSKW